MSDWQSEFLESCCSNTEAAAVGEGAFGPGPAIWVGRREVAHFDEERSLDVRLTNSVIRTRRNELKSDERVALRRSGSDWIELFVASDDDVDWATALVCDAIAANVPTAPPGPPPISNDAGVSTDTSSGRWETDGWTAGRYPSPSHRGSCNAGRVTTSAGERLREDALL